VEDEVAEEDGEVLPSPPGRGLVLVVVQQSVHGVGGEGGMILEQKALQTVGEASAHLFCSLAVARTRACRCLLCWCVRPLV